MMSTTHRNETYWLRFTRLHLDQVNTLLLRYWSRRHDEYEGYRCIETILRVLRPLIRHAARSNYAHRSPIGLDVADFEVYAEIAVYKAVVSYDPGRNDNFFAYLYQIINNETIKHIDRELPIPATAFHRLSADADGEDLQTCQALLNAASLHDHERKLAASMPDEDEPDIETEQDGQTVLVDLLASAS